MEVAETKRLCALALRAGREELCPGDECPLWENGSCALERLTADGELGDEWSDGPPVALSERGWGHRATGYAITPS
jgi:hypothetical protein